MTIARLIFCFVLIIICSVTIANSEMFSWTDDNGVKHFSNSPNERHDFTKTQTEASRKRDLADQKLEQKLDAELEQCIQKQNNCINTANKYYNPKYDACGEDGDCRITVAMEADNALEYCTKRCKRCQRQVAHKYPSHVVKKRKAREEQYDYCMKKFQECMYFTDFKNTRKCDDELCRKQIMAENKRKQKKCEEEAYKCLGVYPDR